MVAGGVGWGVEVGKDAGEGIIREFGIDMNTLLRLKWITNSTYCRTKGTLLSVT